MQGIDFPVTAKAIGQAFGATVVGDPEAVAQCISSLEEALNKKAEVLTFLSEKKHASLLTKLEKGIVLATEEMVQSHLPVTFVVVPNPKKVFAEIARQFLPKTPWTGISPQSHIDPKAVLGANVSVGPFAVIAEGAVIGEGTTIYPHAYIGPQVELGRNCEIHPYVTLLVNVRLGDRVRVFSGSVLGSEGFGFIEGDGGFQAMPQIGWVVVEDDVRIGAKCTIDRATLGETRIKRGSILDDQVHVGHNCTVGGRNILCAQVGLAGSTILEEDVMLGGQVGLAGHLRVGKGARLAGQTGSSSNLPGGKTYLGSPALPIEDSIKIFRAARRLPELADRLRKLEEKLDGKTQS
jgi:UDP-3-O-[3-hydroxymyristoyl] glucosamine N-acyltransferase